MLEKLTTIKLTTHFFEQLGILNRANKQGTDFKADNF